MNTKPKFSISFFKFGFCVIKNSQYLTNVLSYLSTPIVQKILAITNPTLNCQVIDIQRIPIKFSYNEKIGFNGGKCISISKTDWDSFETSWDFEKLPQLPMKNTKEFRSIINGIVDKPSSVILFNWISYSEKSYRQKDVPMTDVKVPEFIESMPY